MRQGLLSPAIIATQKCKSALPKLEELDADPTPLLDYLEKLPGHRVGRYFEALTNYWLRRLTSFDVVTAKRCGSSA